MIKLLAYVHTGSAAMLSEAIHSLADMLNQVCHDLPHPRPQSLPPICVLLIVFPGLWNSAIYSCPRPRPPVRFGTNLCVIYYPLLSGMGGHELAMSTPSSVESAYFSSAQASPVTMVFRTCSTHIPLRTSLWLGFKQVPFFCCCHKHFLVAGIFCVRHIFIGGRM